MRIESSAFSASDGNLEVSPARRPGEPLRAATAAYDASENHTLLNEAVEAGRTVKSDAIAEDLQMLEGQEWNSFLYEGMVSVNDGKVGYFGEVLDDNLESKPALVSYLFSEYWQSEFGGPGPGRSDYEAAVAESSYAKQASGEKTAATYHIIYTEPHPERFGVDYLEREELVEADTEAEAKSWLRNREPEADVENAEFYKIDD